MKEVKITSLLGFVQTVIKTVEEKQEETNDGKAQN